jgi:hypothetical protein
MIVYRCTACTHDHKTLSVQGMNEPQCERCGLTAFAQIHLPDVELPDELEVMAAEDAEIERAYAEAGVRMDDEPPGVAIYTREGGTDDDDAPATPRDGVAETVEVAALRASDNKPRDVCGQVGCYDKATHRFTWPGHSERTACPEHAKAATRIAEAMGFFLEVPAL